MSSFSSHTMAVHCWLCGRMSESVCNSSSNIFGRIWNFIKNMFSHLHTTNTFPPNIRIHRWILGWIEILHAQQHRRDISWLREALHCSHWIGTEATSKNGNFFENLNLTSDKRARVGKNNDNASKLFHIFFFSLLEFFFPFFLFLHSQLSFCVAHRNCIEENCF